MSYGDRHWVEVTRTVVTLVGMCDATQSRYTRDLLQLPFDRFSSLRFGIALRIRHRPLRFSLTLAMGRGRDSYKIWYWAIDIGRM